MHAVALLLTMSALGVDYGWQPGEDGQLEYIIQIEPELIETLKKGEVDLLSEIPEELQGVRKFRIRIGKGPVPREGLKEAQAKGTKPTENFANQPPNLQGDPRTSGVGVRGAPDPRAAPGTGNKLLNPPPGPLQNEPPVPDERDRFTQGGAGTFPAVSRTAGVGRSPAGTGASSSAGSDRFPAKGGEATQPPASSPFRPGASRSSFEQDPAVPNVNDGAWNSAPSSDPRYADPRVDDPRYADSRATDPRLNDPRYRSAPPDSRYYQSPMPPYQQDPRYADPRYADARAGQWSQYGPAPLRDPERGYYPDANLGPLGRPVDYREVARAPTGAATTPAANTTAPPTTSAAAATGTGAAAGTPPTASISSNRNTTPREASLADDPNLRPWWPLTFTAMLLFASIGLNFYLGWIAQGIYQRYRALLSEVRNVRAAAV